ncbi:hypothetical protein PYI79_08300 [Staphylococcus epidermidis]|nr:hypothetical protein [Staphylococcus epidermidis]MDH8773787.1 hypothetical protein [Staphylococcus epidermidis]MDH8818054.1 hypothetical protein [Staphylococcus epidermidis]MDH8845041.1 hypothetical protein [Staphylococcus epidermidis]MDH8862758.1 hypothetical protein [Staphylococcus epidermidis]
MKLILQEIAISLKGIHEELKVMNERNKPQKMDTKKKEKKAIKHKNFI